MLECEHKLCVPKKSFKTLRGLQRHNTNVVHKAKITGRHELTVAEAPSEQQRVNRVLHDFGLTVSVREGKVYADGHECQIDDLLGAIRIAVVVSRPTR